MFARLDDGSTPGDLARETLDRLRSARSWSRVETATLPGASFEPEPILAGWLAREEFDLVVVLTDRPARDGLDERVRWLRVASGEGDDDGIVRLGVEPTPEGGANLLVVVARSGAGGGSGLEAALIDPSGERLASAPLAFGPHGLAEAVLPEPELDEAVLAILDAAGRPIADALAEDDRVPLSRAPPVRVGVRPEDPSLAMVRQAVDAWGELGVAAAGTTERCDLAFLAAPGEPEAWRGARAILLPGADSRGVAYGETTGGGWIDRSEAGAFGRPEVLARIEARGVRRLESLPRGSRPVAWAGPTPVLWESAGGDRVSAFDLFAEESEPVLIVLHELVASVRPGAGRLEAREPIAADVEVARMAEAPDFPEPPPAATSPSVELAGWLAALALALVVARGAPRLGRFVGPWRSPARMNR